MVWKHLPSRRVRKPQAIQLYVPAFSLGVHGCGRLHWLCVALPGCVGFSQLFWCELCLPAPAG